LIESRELLAALFLFACRDHALAAITNVEVALQKRIWRASWSAH